MNAVAIGIVALVSALLVAFIGFAAHRASLCTVRAVAEIMTSGTAWMLSSFAKAALWTIAVSGVILLTAPASAAPCGKLYRTPWRSLGRRQAT